VAGWVVAWLALVTRPGAWALAAVHWPVAVVMLCGSFVAGSTPMGGGSVAFPALVLLFGHPPAMARDFGFAIQSVGMTSALVFIAARGIDVERRMLAWAFAGSIGGLAIGTWVLAPVVPAAWVKLVLATLWLVFGAWLVDGLRRVRTVPDDGRPAAALGLVGRGGRPGRRPDRRRRRDGGVRRAGAGTWLGRESRGPDGRLRHGPGVAGRAGPAGGRARH